MIRYFWVSLRSASARRQGLTLLTIFGVALGVASVWSIAVLNINAMNSFRASLHAVTGDADLSITGTSPTFSETLYPKVLATPDVQSAWPLYHTYVTRAGRDDYFFEILGVDVLTGDGEAERGSIGASEKKSSNTPRRSVADALTTSGWVAVSPSLAKENAWSIGDRFDVASGSRRISLVVGDIVDFSTRSPQASNRLLVMDVSQAQTLLDGKGKLHEIDLRLRPHADRAEVTALLKSRLGPSVEVLTPEQQERRAAGLLEAFRLNLTALSFISLFVGLFLVYASTQASLLQRRAEFGVLRSLGATRAQLFGLLMGQAAWLGAWGVAIGIPLGYATAKSNLSSVSATLSNLYILSEIQSLHISPALYAVAVIVGLGGAMSGAVVPIWEVSRRDPLALLSWVTLSERARRWALPLAALTIAIGAITLLWYLLVGKEWKPAGFVLAAACMVSITGVVPAGIQLLFGSWAVHRFRWRYSLRSLALRLQTVALATAALTASVSMLIGITLMIQSFRTTVQVWAQKNIQADIYISTDSWMRARSEATLDNALVHALETLPSVRAVDRQRYLGTMMDGHRLGLSGVRMGLPGPEKRFMLRAGNPAEAYRALQHDHAVVIGEPLSRRAHLGVGDHLLLQGLHGPVSLPIVGVSYDYSTDWGTAVMDYDAMTDVFGTGPANNVALYLKPGFDAEAMVDTLKSQFRDRPLVIRSNKHLLAEVIRIFDQTFAVTRLLQVMCLLTAVCGISLALLILGQQSLPELALYRALGATRGQVSRFFLGQGIGIGLVGIGVGCVGGVLLELVLIFCIHRAYFGWSIPMTWPWMILGKELLIIFAACLVASLYPAWRAGATPVSQLSREEL